MDCSTGEIPIAVTVYCDDVGCFGIELDQAWYVNAKNVSKNQQSKGIVHSS